MSSPAPLGLNGVIPIPQEEVMSSTKTRVSKVATVVIPVADQDRQIEFYVDKLGLEKRVDLPFGGQYRWVEVSPSGTETTIALAPPPPDGDTQVGKRETGISFYSEDIDGYHEQLKAAGVDVDPEVSRMGDPVPPMFWLRDAEGNSLLVIG
jgi:catechol 2,3-dioxygenase-like lactoylglutathione lyase family enzyme